jgi:hypothetical protein
LAFEALILLAVARLLVVATPFRFLSRLLGRSRRQGSGSTASLDEARQIGWALNAVGARVPWRCKCLERAVAGKFMLQRRGYSSYLTLGVRRPRPGDPIRAHAWLRSGLNTVVGEEAGVDAYSIVNRLGDVQTTIGKP